MTNETTEIISTETKQELTTNANELLNAVNTMPVHSEVENNAILEIVARAKKGEKIVKEKLQPLDDSTKKARQDFIALSKGFLLPLEEIRKIGSKKSNTWLEVEQEKREAKQRKLDEEYERKQEAERKRVEEKQRKLDEEYERKQEAERKRVADLKAEAEAEGKVSTVVEKVIIKKVAEEKVIHQQIVAQVGAPANASYTNKWYADDVNVKLLCRAIADGKASVNLVSANMPAFNKMATAMQCDSPYLYVTFKKKNVTTQRV